MASATTPLAARPVETASEAAALADELLAAMASIRRRGRLLAGRPVELSALTASQVDLVRLVRRRPQVSVAQAADELRLAANTVSTLVGQLTDAGLMIRTVDVRDRRVARLELAPDMRRKVGDFRDRRVAALAGAIARLSTSDHRALSETVGVLERLAAALPDQEPEPTDG